MIFTILNTNVRTFGSDPKEGAGFCPEYEGADECGVAVAIKHFPRRWGG